MATPLHAMLCQRLPCSPPMPLQPLPPQRKHAARVLRWALLQTLLECVGMPRKLQLHHICAQLRRNPTSVLCAMPR